MPAFSQTSNCATYNMSMNNIPIDIALHFNYLGIILDEHLSWKTMLRWSLGKLSKVNNILNRLKLGL